ncbi:M12 family metallo-peptidase [Pseudomonas sp. KU43P]|uniref:M12 family metallo-peptidase n=1 Tax=Pseudomonas sp. KU43P TaxID=2487887 RepID=UPI0012A91050|nr:M12 family metallo-peptidase [Pseudomonas sp. KU43P]BBH46663.1 peptidyl-Asp metalloendopeptidase [Pseudomonas sp. KU43P]
MRNLTIMVGLLALGAVLWLVQASDTVFLSADQDKEGPRPSWIARLWTANVALEKLTVSSEKLGLTLADQKPLTAHRVRAFTRHDGTLVWHGTLSAAGEAAPATGTLTAAMNNIVLFSWKGRATGTLRWNGQVYRLLPTAQGYVLEEVNGAQLPPDHTPDETMASASHPTTNPKAHEPGHATIRVLIVATKNAAEAHEDLPALARLAIEESNFTYLNSDINMSLELADFRQLDYQQGSSPDIDLRRLVATNDGYMDGVHPMRDDLDADVVVLVVDTIMEMCGRAQARPATSESAFVYVNLKCIGVSRYTTGHEIAHLQGASHEYSEGSNDPFLHGHGYIHQPDDQAGWRTVMATVATQSDVRLPFWSDPERYMNGDPMGDAETADNRRLLEETKWTVAGFR